MFHKSVAIIGAGLSAAVCAKALNGFVKNITVFEQAEHVGGRLYFNDEVSTTSSFTVSTPFFQQVIEHWVVEGLVCEKKAWNVEILGSDIHTLNTAQTEFKVEPSMTHLVERLFQDVNVKLNSEVSEMEQSDQKWRLFDYLGAYLGQFDVVIFASTNPSLHELAKPSQLLYHALQKIEFSSVWSVVVQLKDDITNPYDSAIYIGSPIASSFINNPKSVVLTASPEWSEKYSALSRNEAAKALSDAYCQHMQLDENDIISASAKFWPHKAVINTLGEDCLLDAELGLGACGDWCTAPRVEGAVLSGFSMADRVMKFCSEMEERDDASG